MTTVLDLNRPISTAPYKKIKAVRFTVLSPDEVECMSVAEVYKTQTYEGPKALPVKNGLNDPRMGPIDFMTPCETCSMNMDFCPGHFGHIKLAQPMFSWGFLKTTVHCLRCVCFYCSRLLVDHDDLNLKRALLTKNMKQRLGLVTNLCRTKRRCIFGQNSGGGQNSNNAGLGGYGGPDEFDEDGALGAGHQGLGGGHGGGNSNIDELASGCGYSQPRYVQVGAQVFVVFPEDENNISDGKDRQQLLTGQQAYDILSRIPERDKEIMGFVKGISDPSWLILRNFPVPPPPVRPTVSFGTDRSEDDLTAKMLDMVKTNEHLKKLMDEGAGSHISQEYANLLQYHIYTLCDNNINSVPQATTKSQKPIKSVRERLKGKDGRLRGNLMGKRVDFSARTVIGGDPMLDIDQVGVPRSIAFNLTFPERVTPINYEKLLSAVKKGPTEWPGAKFVIKADGTKLDLRYTSVGGQGVNNNMLNDNSDAVELKVGDKVERHMVDDDFVIFNRQPSLHKMSMMGHRAKILPWSTFRLNLSATSPYNADFDGDEMNLHLAQSHETRAEIKHIMLVPRQMVSPQGNKPVMGIVQDSCLALSKFTKRDCLMRRDQVFNLLMLLPDWRGQVPIPCVLRPEPMWSGKQIFGCLLKPRLNVSKENGLASKNKGDSAVFSKSDHRVIIRDGVVISGVIDKKIVGTQSGGVLHLTWLDHGPEACKILISYIQKLVNGWLLHHSFTCGAQDIVANDETMARVASTLKEAKAKVADTMKRAQRGELESQPGKTMIASFEAAVNRSLNQAREDAGRIGSDSLDERNNIIAMVQCGSKGSNINIAQIIACVGQQNVEGKRISNGFRDRTLPHFPKDDYGPESRGFVENSYLAGLTPEELFFHAMGGREGVIDTAVKTSETGYIQRRLVKSMETLKVRYDGTVRSDTDQIIQLLYGEDGYAAEYIEDQDIELIKMSHADCEKKLRHNHEDGDSYGKGWLDKLGPGNEEFLRLLKSGQYPDARHILNAEFEKLKAYKKQLCEDVYKDGESKQHLPVPIERLVQTAKLTFQKGDMSKADYYTPVEICKKVGNLVDSLKTLKGLSPEDVLGQEVLQNSLIVMNAHLRTRLNSRRLLEQDKLTKSSIDWLMGEVKLRFEKSLSQAGEMVGTIAAQSVGEPATQMTLNTFHFAGVGSKNVTLGVPRLKELINVAKTVKTPSLTVYLDKESASTQEAARSVSADIAYCTLEHVTSFSQIFYDPDIEAPILPDDLLWVQDYLTLPDEDLDQSRLSPWVLRIALDLKMMVDKKIQIRNVGERIAADFTGDLDCIFSDSNSDNQILRLRILKDVGAVQGDVFGDIGGESGATGDMEDDEDKDCRFLKNIEKDLLKDFYLKGVHGIRKVSLRQANITKYDSNTGSFPKPTGNDSAQEWVVDTEGCSLDAILQLDFVDATRTTSNDVVEVMQVLGVEAVRKKLYDEVLQVISFDGSYVNYRHLSILCDVMSNRGHLMAITRHGVNRADFSPMMKCSFEETVEILTEAAMFGVTDHCRGVSENIILGQLPRLGTGEFDILIDHSREDVVVNGNEYQSAVSMLDEAKPQIESSVAPGGRDNLQLIGAGAEGEYGKSVRNQLALTMGGFSNASDLQLLAEGADASELQTPIYFMDNFTEDDHKLQQTRERQQREAERRMKEFGQGLTNNRDSNNNMSMLNQMDYTKIPAPKLTPIDGAGGGLGGSAIGSGDSPLDMGMLGSGFAMLHGLGGGGPGIGGGPGGFGGGGISSGGIGINSSQQAGTDQGGQGGQHHTQRRRPNLPGEAGSDIMLGGQGVSMTSQPGRRADLQPAGLALSSGIGLSGNNAMTSQGQGNTNIGNLISQGLIPATSGGGNNQNQMNNAAESNVPMHIQLSGAAPLGSLAISGAPGGGANYDAPYSFPAAPVPGQQASYQFSSRVPAGYGDSGRYATPAFQLGGGGQNNQNNNKGKGKGQTQTGPAATSNMPAGFQMSMAEQAEGPLVAPEGGVVDEENLPEIDQDEL